MKLKGWSWLSFCKTHYASDPRCGGLPNFLRCHLGVVALLDEAKNLGILGTVEAPIAAYPNFEHLEAEGQRLLPEQLKEMLKALGRSNLLRGDAH